MATEHPHRAEGHPPTDDVTVGGAALPPFEIFRAGRHVAESGQVYAFSAGDIAAIAAAYDPEKREAPIVIGHPATDAPAYGWVATLARQDDTLTVTARDVAPAFADMLKTGRYKKRSAAFYPPRHPSNPTPDTWYLRHVGFLGAAQPALAGLKDIQFADDADGLVFFNESEEPSQEEKTVDEKELAALKEAAERSQAEAEALKARFAEAEAQNAALKQEIAAFVLAAETARHQANVAFAEAEVKAGRLLPANRGAAIAVLDLVAASDPVEFAEGDVKKTVTPLEFVKNLLAGQKPLVQFGEFASGEATPSPRDDAELAAAASRLATEKGITFADAARKVLKF